MPSSIEELKEKCPQPSNIVCKTSTNPKRYCNCKVSEEARQKCINKGEGWRYGIGEYKNG